jgi:hypothetical protein
MDGRYPGGHFYRPVANLSFALDWGVWGQRAFGYHSSDLLILIAQVLLTFALATTLLGPGWGSLAAAAVVGLHPLQLEVLPVSARRADGLCTLFILVTLWLQLRPSRWSAAGRSVLVALAALLAVGAKETGAIAVPLALVAQLLFSREGSGVAGVRDALRRVVAPAAAVAVFVLLRGLVLGGVGGYDASSFAGGWTRGPAAASSFSAALLVPQPQVTDSSLGVVWLVGSAGLLGILLALACVADDVRRGGTAFGRRIPAILLVLAAWFGALSFVAGLSGRAEPWYASPFLPAYALLIGLVVDLAVRSLVQGVRGIGVLAAVVALALLGGSLRYSPLLVSYPEWSALSRRERSFLTEFDLQLKGLEPGMGAVVRGLPLWQPPLGPVGIRGASGLADYSVQAYADLLDYRVPIRVEESLGTRVPIAAEGTIRIEVVADHVP